MNVGKSMMKVDLAKTLGAQYAEMAQAVENDRLRQEGARDSLKLAAQRVGALGLQLDKALEDGELSAANLKDPKQVEIFIKRWNKRAVGVLDNLATAAEIAIQIASGRAKGLKAAEEVVQKTAETELAMLRELQRQIDAGEATLEEAQGREAPQSLKHQREDEGGEKAEATSEAVPKGKALAKKKAGEKAPPRPKKKPVPKKG